MVLVVLIKFIRAEEELQGRNSSLLNHKGRDRNHPGNQRPVRSKTCACTTTSYISIFIPLLHAKLEKNQVQNEEIFKKCKIK